MVNQLFNSMETRQQSSGAEALSTRLSAKERAQWLLKPGFLFALSECGFENISEDAREALSSLTLSIQEALL